MFRKLFKGCMGIALCALSVTACDTFPDVSTPSQINTRQVRLVEDVKNVKLNVLNVEDSDIRYLVKDYARNGRDQVRMTVSYAPGQPMDEAQIKRQARALKARLNADGMSDIDLSFVAVKDMDFVGDAVLSWQSLQVRPPENCVEKIPGYYGTETMYTVRQYRIGCQVGTEFSKMVASPADLRGRGGTVEDGSRRHGAVIENYSAGVRNEDIEGLEASEIIGD